LWWGGSGGGGCGGVVVVVVRVKMVVVVVLLVLVLVLVLVAATTVTMTDNIYIGRHYQLFVTLQVIFLARIKFLRHKANVLRFLVHQVFMSHCVLFLLCTDLNGFADTAQ
jgi:hypothetical protein